jgi:hypothetical protein
MQLGTISGLEFGPNRIFVEEEYSLDDKLDDKYVAYCRKKGLRSHPHEQIPGNGNAGDEQGRDEEEKKSLGSAEVVTEYEEDDEEGGRNGQDMDGSEDHRANAENEVREEHRIVEMILD